MSGDRSSAMTWIARSTSSGSPSVGQDSSAEMNSFGRPLSETHPFCDCGIQEYTIDPFFPPGADCESECACGSRLEVSLGGTAIGISASPIPFPPGLTFSSATLIDDRPCPESSSLQGFFAYTAVGFATPVFGYGYTAIKLGSAVGKGFGNQKGFDVGADAYGGAVAVTQTQRRCCR